MFEKSGFNCTIILSRVSDDWGSKAGAEPGIFQSRGGFWEEGHFDKCFVYNIKKKSPAGENFSVLLQHTLKPAF